MKRVIASISVLLVFAVLLAIVPVQSLAVTAKEFDEMKAVATRISKDKYNLEGFDSGIIMADTISKLYGYSVKEAKWDDEKDNYINTYGITLDPTDKDYDLNYEHFVNLYYAVNHSVTKEEIIGAIKYLYPDISDTTAETMFSLQTRYNRRWWWKTADGKYAVGQNDFVISGPQFYQYIGYKTNGDEYHLYLSDFGYGKGLYVPYVEYNGVRYNNEPYYDDEGNMEYSSRYFDKNGESVEEAMYHNGGYKDASVYVLEYDGVKYYPIWDHLQSTEIEDYAYESGYGDLGVEIVLKYVNGKIEIVSDSSIDNFPADMIKGVVTDKVETVVYKISGGESKTYAKDSNAGLVITSEADFSKFVSVKVDGNVIAPENYTAEKGSTKITLKPSYLATLSSGEHTVSIVSTDGEAIAKITVADTAEAFKNSKSPITGDKMPYTFLIMLIVSGLALVMLGRKQKA